MGMAETMLKRICSSKSCVYHVPYLAVGESVCSLVAGVRTVTGN